MYRKITRICGYQFKWNLANCKKKSLNFVPANNKCWQNVTSDCGEPHTIAIATREANWLQGQAVEYELVDTIRVYPRSESQLHFKNEFTLSVALAYQKCTEVQLVLEQIDNTIVAISSENLKC